MWVGTAVWIKWMGRLRPNLCGKSVPCKVPQWSPHGHPMVTRWSPNGHPHLILQQGGAVTASEDGGPLPSRSGSGSGALPSAARGHEAVDGGTLGLAKLSTIQESGLSGVSLREMQG